MIPKALSGLDLCEDSAGNEKIFHLIWWFRVCSLYTVSRVGWALTAGSTGYNLP